MKLSHKLLMVSAATLMGVSPVVPAVQATTVQAAKKTSTKKPASKKGTIKLSHNAYVYDKNGKRLKEYMGSSKYTTIAKGVTLNYNGKKKIAGKQYYSLGNNAYVKATNVGYVDGKKVKKAKTTTATLKKNAYIYDANGKTDKQKLKKGTKVSVDQLIYIGKKLYYRISGQTDQFIKSANVASTTGPDLKPVNNKPKPANKPSDDQKESTVITLNHNAYIYDGEGNTEHDSIKKGKQVTVDKLQYIGKKLYFHINDSNYPGDDQWVKKSNVGVITGKQLEPANDKPGVDHSQTIITLGKDASVYNNLGVVQPTQTFAKGHTARVTELRYIWVSADNKAELFYKLQSDKNGGYIKDDDVSEISGPKLSPVNTPQDAKNDITVAMPSDKTALQQALNQAATVKGSDAYKLSAKTLRDNYDSAITSGNQINTGSSTIGQVNDALKKINTAQAALNGKKIVVADLNNLTIAEADQIASLAATANDVDVNAIQFSDNNSTLTITGSNSFAQKLNIADYATTK
ncbi:SLAP domain-containing protein [Lactobacillus sp. ESL0684]|uniref:SLAP domain-containing protein n=1 Tax=Lactobacillus sp. ESL0684 TaxID=2983213 RepID=UPI0023F6449B|nr:SLAP domain-containing protein [Lactobacillus sp. ESL0684]WEV43945.1 SLAP domain-containing protein [Lactobacillus sp. ESL0684]